MIKYRKSFVGLLIATLVGIIIFNGLFISFAINYMGCTFGDFFTTVIPETVNGIFTGLTFTGEGAWKSIVMVAIMAIAGILVIYSFIVFIAKKRARYIPSLIVNVLATYAALIVFYIFADIVKPAIEAKDGSANTIIALIVFAALAFILSIVMTIKAIQVSYTLKKEIEIETTAAVTTEEATTTINSEMDDVVVTAIGEEREPEVEEPDDGKFSVKKVYNRVKKATKKATKKVENKIKARKVYHISKRASDNLWVIKFAGGEKVIKTFPTKKEAVAYSETLAANQDAVVLTHASKGKNQGKIYEKVNTEKKDK